MKGMEDMKKFPNNSVKMFFIFMFFMPFMVDYSW